MPSIIFYGGEDQAIAREGVQSFFDRITHLDKQLHIVEGSPHAVFTSTEFQPYWKVLLAWLNEKILKKS
jgi:alpha-beta hydrolase superfamily lysophospholipase